MKKRGRFFDPRRHWQQTQVRLLIGGLAVVLVVGGGLVWLLYGRTAAITALSCLLGVAGVIALLWFLMALLDRWVKEEEP